MIGRGKIRIMSVSSDLPPSSDPLGETLHLLRLNGVLYCRSELTAPWGIDLPQLDGCMMIQIVTAGHCWIEIEGEEPRLLQQGSLALMPYGTAHTVRSSLQADVESLSDIPVELVGDRYEIMRFGGGGDLTRITYCGVRFDHVAARRLIDLLPRMLQVDTWDHEDSWLQSTARFISREAREMRPGGETVITRLADILIIQAIRAWIDSAPEAEQGWLAALRDSWVGPAIAAIHREPETDWTVSTLAKEVGMSRSGFSARFTELVGESAGHYLTDWRMQLARTQLLESSEPLSVIAIRVGYQSEAAFSRAFKRVIGVSPGSVRRSRESSPPHHASIAAG